VLLAGVNVADDDADVEATIDREREVLDIGDRRSLEGRFLDQARVVEVDVPGANPEPACFWDCGHDFLPLMQ
jgi:hypothetical protein